MAQSLIKIQTTYDAVAREYAEQFLGEHDRKPKDCEILQRFAREVKDRSPIWEFGCGPGHTAKYLRDRDVEIYGMDLSKSMVKEAKSRYPALYFQQGNMLELEFTNGSIAAILAFYTIVHFTPSQVSTAFHEIFRVLKPGGLLLCTFHIGNQTIHLDEFLGKPVDVDFTFFTTDQIVDSLCDAGFCRVELIERDPYPDVEYQSRRAYVFGHKPG